MPQRHTRVEIDDDRAFSVTLGDITEEDVDAIVNAANGQLEHGGGVAAAIASAAGSALREESRARVREHGPVSTGDAAVTTAGDLPHRGVIHAVGPRQGEGDEEEKLTAAVASALDRADENGWTSLALPAISAGIFGVPYHVCARSYVAGVKRHLEARPDSSVTDVRLCLFQPDEELLETVEDALEEGF